MVNSVKKQEKYISSPILVHTIPAWDSLEGFFSPLFTIQQDLFIYWSSIWQISDRNTLSYITSSSHLENLRENFRKSDKISCNTASEFGYLLCHILFKKFVVCLTICLMNFKGFCLPCFPKSKCSLLFSKTFLIYCVETSLSRTLSNSCLFSHNIIQISHASDSRTGLKPGWWE